MIRIREEADELLVMILFADCLWMFALVLLLAVVE